MFRENYLSQTILCNDSCRILLVLLILMERKLKTDCPLDKHYNDIYCSRNSLTEQSPYFMTAQKQLELICLSAYYVNLVTEYHSSGIPCPGYFKIRDFESYILNHFYKNQLHSVQMNTTTNKIVLASHVQIVPYATIVSVCQ